MRNVLEALLAAHDRGQNVVLTELVETRGSTPQKAGAAMLVFPDGAQVGTLGGGCVEAEVKRKALALLAEGRPELLTFQLDHDYGWDDGLICGGRMKMLVDPVRHQADVTYYRSYLDRLSVGAGCTEAVILEDRDGRAAGTRLLFDAVGGLIHQQGTAAPDHVAAVLKPLAARPRPYVAEGISFLPALPRCRLVIVGAGHVGQKAAALAADVDFDVHVIDDRPDYCSAERFPTAQALHTGPFEDILPPFETSETDFCLVITRGHNHDQQALFHLVRKPFRYLGMIGSNRKIRMIFDDLKRDGIPQERLDKVHAPLGLDIGSQTVAEIAVSIVAELIACRNLGIDSPTISSMKHAAQRPAPQIGS